jgi:DNA-binding XRE family transcriptional regulator
MRDIARLDDYRPTPEPERVADGDAGTEPQGSASQASPRRDPEMDGGTAPAPERLWRDVVGEGLRALRHDRGETLTRTAARAGISPQYLSEMERGLKEPSSEMIAAVAGALGMSLHDLVGDVARRLDPATPASRRATEPQLLAAA